MKSGRTLVSLAQELERQLHSKKDLIVPSQLVHHSTGDDGRTHIIVNEAGNPVRYPPSNLHDGDMSTAWRCSGGGVGETVTITLPEQIRIGEGGSGAELARLANQGTYWLGARLASGFQIGGEQTITFENGRIRVWF